MFVEGLRLAEEALRAGLRIERVFYSDDFESDQRSRDLLDDLRSKCGDVFAVDKQVLGSLSDTKSTQGLVLTVNRPLSGREVIEREIELSRRTFPLVILLHGINNPANLGALLRTAAAAGVDGIILTRNSTGAFSAKALRGSMGAAFRVPLWENAEYSEALDWARIRGLLPVCADIHGGRTYTEFDWKKPRLLIFGSEAHGLSATERSGIDESVRIPMESGTESLNLAIASGIILFEARRQTIA